ncbi:MAG: response regulator [Magnetospirillum sp.]|nr:response regulator [Magnetospirillum sp.]
MALGTLKVLVLDDQEIVRLVVRKMLEGIGVGTIVEADDGHAGLEAVAAERPDVVICDIRMRRLDGFGFIEALRGRAGGTPPVILLTAHDEVEIAERARDAGAFAVLTKPASPKALADALAAATGPRP